MKSATALTALIAALGFSITSAMPTAAAQPGWTHDEYLEYLALNDTTNWPGLSKVTHINLDEASSQPTDLDKRSGGNNFIAWELDDCKGQSRFSYTNFNCGVCISSTTPAYSGQLSRQKNTGNYPTADWYSGRGCSGTKVHHQGIKGDNAYSCDTAWEYGVTKFYSAMLYEGC